MNAVISDCGLYRYTLTRYFDDCDIRPFKVLFIMLNPSTADASLDDPTIRRCMNFAKREGATEMTVVNLFALRSTDPSVLKSHPDPVGPLNDHYIQQELYKHRNYEGIVVAAWGAQPFAVERANAVAKMARVVNCLGTTKDGHPRHPLYLPNNAELKTWELSYGCRR